MFKLANAFENETRSHFRVFVLWGFDSADLAHGEEKIGKSRFNDNWHMESGFSRPENLALESLPSVSDSAEEVIERLTFNRETAVSRDAVVACADRAAMDSNPCWVKVPRRLLSRIYGNIEHNN